MAEQKKKDTLKHIMINFGVMLVLIGSTAVKAENLTLFFMGLILLALQIFDFRAVEDAKRLVTAEIMISGTLIIAAITQLVMNKSFGTPQVFLVVLLLGSILIVVESLRKFAELD
ncbi:MAG TPA: hypothetical protein DDX85_07100 [Nitrospiraceae bacterium]|nr:hypothetical protein [Nitrospiraceae bacterium]